MDRRKEVKIRDDTPMGAWERVKATDWAGHIPGFDCYRCPNCGVEFFDSAEDPVGVCVTDWQFCPSCGARIEGVKYGEEDE